MTEQKNPRYAKRTARYNEFRYKADITFFIQIDHLFQCTATCGVGMQMRNVYCATREGPKMLRILTNDHCANEKKIKGMQMCSVRPCQAGWYIYPWEPVRVLHDYSYIRDIFKRCSYFVPCHSFHFLLSINMNPLFRFHARISAWC